MKSKGSVTVLEVGPEMYDDPSSGNIIKNGTSNSEQLQKQ